MSLRFRLNLMITLTLLMMVGVGTVFVLHNARRSVSQEVQSSVNMALQWVDAGVSRYEGGQQGLIGWLAGLAKMKNIRHLRIQMSQPPQAFTDLSRPADTAEPSLAPAWFAWAVTPALTVGERRFAGNHGEPIRVLIEANPIAEINEAWLEARSFLILMIALAAAVSVLVHVTLGRAFQLVAHILRGMEDIEQGDYSKRLPRFGLPEFDRISAAFNLMAQALSKARDENRALTRHSLRLQEEERRNLAQELHDELGQSLTAIKVMAASLRAAESLAGTDAEAVQTIMSQCDRLFQVVRSMMRRLRPLMLDELGLLPSLNDMIANWQARHPEVQIRAELEAEVEEFADSAKIHLFRIVQESLTNISKHAKASRVGIGLCLREDNCIHLKVADDGQGFNPALPRTGFGLHGIFERVASLDGLASLQTAPGCGTTLEIAIPCETIKP